MFFLAHFLSIFSFYRFPFFLSEPVAELEEFIWGSLENSRVDSHTKGSKACISKCFIIVDVKTAALLAEVLLLMLKKM